MRVRKKIIFSRAYDAVTKAGLLAAWYTAEGKVLINVLASRDLTVPQGKLESMAGNPVPPHLL